MANFQVLTGSKLGNAIKGFGKTVATFSEREHQLAFSALNHVELHTDPKYLNALFAVTPANYRKGLVSWATAFGKVSFDAKERVFQYVKTKKSDMDQAMQIAPANYEKTQNAAAEVAFDEQKYLEGVVKKLTEKGADPRVLQAVKGALNLYKVNQIAAIKKEKTVNTPAAPAATQEGQVANAA